MTSSRLHTRVALALIAASLAIPIAYADKPEWAGRGKGNSGEAHEKGKGKGHGNRGRGDDDEHRRHRGDFFNDQHRGAVHEYYGAAFSSGRCPPGLAKKNNGCMPPGQAKKWRMGRPLPREVVHYQVPQDLIVRLGPPPPGHRYVRVGGDILLMTTTNAIIVDAIQNLGR